MRFAVDNVLDVLAPTNFPAINPAVLKATLDSRRAELRRRARGTSSRDMAQAAADPVDGRQVAVRGRREPGRRRPGAVVLRTAGVRADPVRAADAARCARSPLLFMPPMINKYYVTDLAPDRSMIEHAGQAGPAGLRDLVAQPGRRARRLVARHLRAGGGRGARRGQAITGLRQRPPARPVRRRDRAVRRRRPPGRKGEGDRIAGLTLGVCVIDNEHAGTAGAIVDPGGRRWPSPTRPGAAT